MAFYFFDGKKAVGPFEAAELLGRPDFTARTLVRVVGAASGDAWKPAASFPELGKAKPGPAPITLDPAALEASLNVLIDAAAWTPEPTLSAPFDKLVLIVDDDDNVRELIESGATMGGFRTLTAVNGLDAVDKLSARTPDLIVTDLMMPGQGGFEFLRGLQSLDKGRIPVFVVSGRALDASTVAMIRQEANVVEFFAKPIKLAAFIDALHRHLKTAPPPKRA